MTLSEEMNNIKTHIGWAKKVLTGEVGKLFIESVETIMRNQNKYRWHDLRKNPDDLPEPNTYVLAVDDDFDQFTALLSDENYLWRADCVYENGSIDDHDVIAWREIEPFEGGE